MTLKSLYISDRPETTSTPPFTFQSFQPTSPPPPTQSPAPSNPPPPTSSLPYTPSTLSSLIMRYEPPSPFTRWDTPLFTIPSTDTHPDYHAIWTALFPEPTRSLSKKALSQLPSTSKSSQSTQLDSKTTVEVKPHAATILPKATSASALQTLESSTADVAKTLLLAAREQNCANGEGGLVTFIVLNTGKASTATATITAGREEEAREGIKLQITIPLNVILTQPLLQRLRRKYTQIQRGGIAHGVGHVSGREEAVRGFVGFLEAEWED